MIDGNLVRIVADAGELAEGDLVIEVGPGTGTLTLGGNVQSMQEHDPTPIKGNANAIAPFSTGRVQLLNSGYAVRTNIRYKRTGHLVRNRFYSQQVESEAHLLELCRYVVLNPVRAGLCRSPADWPWSSYRATAGLDPEHPFLSTNGILSLFAEDRLNAQKSYRDYVEDALNGFAPRPAASLRV